MHKLNKYKIGLAVIGGVTLILLVVVLVQAGAVKHDKQTYKKAADIADKLQTYVYNHNRAPASLQTVGATDVPEEITYTRLTNYKYRFCVEYKQDSGFDAGDLAMQLLTGGASDPYSRESETSTEHYLYLTSKHHKGQNCKTVVLDYLDSYNQDPYTDPGQNSSNSVLQ